MMLKKTMKTLIIKIKMFHFAVKMNVIYGCYDICFRQKANNTD